MGLLTPKGKKGDKKGNSNTAKNAGQQSKFIQKGSSKGPANATKGRMTGGANRGS